MPLSLRAYTKLHEGSRIVISKSTAKSCYKNTDFRHNTANEHEYIHTVRPATVATMAAETVAMPLVANCNHKTSRTLLTYFLVACKWRYTSVQTSGCRECLCNDRSVFTHRLHYRDCNRRLHVRHFALQKNCTY